MATTTPALASGRTASTESASYLTSSISIERALSRFGWLGDPDDLLAKLGIDRTKLRALEHDDEITAALDTRRDAATITPWRFEHPQARARKFFTEAITPHMPAIMAASWQAVPYGYSVFELVYAEPDNPINPTPGKIGIADVLECPMEWFRVVPGGELLWRDQNLAADPRKFFAAVRQPTLRKPMGDSVLAKAYWSWYFRTHGWKFWAKFLEQAAVPLLIGKTMGDKEGLLNVLRGVTQGPAIAINDTDVVEALDLPGNSGNKFNEFELACVRRIQRLILGQTLTSGTDGGSGNRALGEVHNEVRMDKRRADVMLIASTVQRVANTLAALNGMEPPQFIMEDGSGLEMERAQRDKLLTDAGMLKFTPEYLREKYGLEESDFTIPAEPTPEQPTANAADMAAQVHTFADGSKPARPRFTAGQQAIEDEIDRTLNTLTSPIESKAIQSAIRMATSPEDLIERLGVAMSDADDATFRTVLERAMFAADLTGYGQASKSAGAANFGTHNAFSAPAPAPTPAAPVNVQVSLSSSEMTTMAREMMDGLQATAQQTFAQIREDVQNMPIVIPAPQVTVQNIVEQTPPAVNVTVQPADVTINNMHPKRAVQTVERDENDEITRTVTEYTK